MPLYPNAVGLIRANFKEIAEGHKPQGVAIGRLTDKQLETINEVRATHTPPLPPLVAEVIFYGRHMYRSRVERDGYSVDDVIDQIVSVMDGCAEFIPNSRMTILQSQTARADHYGNTVRDLAVFECSARHPKPELFSVMPKGDVNKPQKR